MTKATLLVLLGSSLLIGAVTKTPQKAKGKTVGSPSRATHASMPGRTGSRTVTKAGKAAVPAGKGGSSRSGRLVATRLVRTKSGRLARVVVHTPPPPSFQTHPDPERYVEIQKALAERGYFKGEANGEWGDDSTDALRRFQAASNLPDDGKISALSLTGLGLGPRHDGSTASGVPLAAADLAPTPTMPVAESPGSSSAPTPSPAPVPAVPAAPLHPPPDR